MNEIRVIHVMMPPSIKGFSVRCIDCGEEYYTVFINECMSYEQQKDSLLHELSHIENDDFSSMQDVDTIEATRHIYQGF